jgi:hypothetical protein
MNCIDLGIHPIRISFGATVKLKAFQVTLMIFREWCRDTVEIAVMWKVT